VGQIRFELTDNEWWLNYSIDSSFRGKGLSKLMITQGVEKLQSDNQIGVFKAQVKPENIASNKVLTSLGWQKESDIYELRKGNPS
jgi:RimJ/RimL family protein N-acetyltransferase